MLCVFVGKGRRRFNSLYIYIYACSMGPKMWLLDTPYNWDRIWVVCDKGCITVKGISSNQGTLPFPTGLHIPFVAPGVGKNIFSKDLESIASAYTTEIHCVFWRDGHIMMRDTALLFGDRLHRDVQLMVELGCFATHLLAFVFAFRVGRGWTFLR